VNNTHTCVHTCFHSDGSRTYVCVCARARACACVCTYIDIDISKHQKDVQERPTWVKRSTGHTHAHTTAEQTTHTNTERATAQLH